MSTGTRRTFAEANRSAHDFRALFDLAYDEWTIAGSIRRRKPDVGDAEHLVRPRFAEVTEYDGLFPVAKTVNLLWKRADELIASGALTKHIYGGTGPRWGDKYRGMELDGMLHEIYTAQPTNWGNQLVIRTGPAEFSERVVTMLKQGGMYRQQDGHLVHVASGEIVPVPDERKYLELAGMGWIEPEDRR